jgi:hypothetical protein
MTGYQKLASSDPAEQALREAWYRARDEKDAGGEGSAMRFWLADRALSDFLWRRANRIVEADRAKSPKAKRNLPVGALSSGGNGRYLP